MMKCDNCGRMSQNEEANFCYYCGHSFREQRQNPSYIPPKTQGFQTGQGMVYVNRQVEMPNVQATVPLVPRERSGTFLSWLGLYGLLFIPVIGWLIFIVIVFMWAFGNNIPESKKNWARATLVFVGVLLIVVFLIAVTMIYYMSNPLYQEMYQEIDQMMREGTLNFETYRELIYKYSEMMMQ